MGSYSNQAVSNYIQGLRAWHILHRLNWLPNDLELSTILKSAAKIAPAQSKRTLREPITVELLVRIGTVLDITNPLDASVWACLTTTFYTAARLGETTVKNLTAFDPSIHIKPSDVRAVQDRGGLEMTEFRLPRTKVSMAGEAISWAAQDGPSDPNAAFENHLRVNNPPGDQHLFAYQHQGSYRPLTKRKFLECLSSAAKAVREKVQHGHSIRIGATLEYLLRGIPFDVVKAKGRWAGDSFTLYLRKHAQVMAPYMQANPEAHLNLARIAMPPPR